MTTRQAIEIIRTAIAEVEWNYPLNYAAAFEMAVEALKAQEPRVLNLSEIYNFHFVWYENNAMNKVFPAMVSKCHSPTRHAFWVDDDFFDLGKFMPDDINYQRTWRCWSARPTDEQRKAVKWDADP